MFHSLSLRAAFALAVLASYYVVSIAVVALLATAPFLLQGTLALQNVWLAYGLCWMPALIVASGLWLPKPRFSVAWPEITEHSEPQFFAVLRELSRSVEARMPDHVYLAEHVFVSGWWEKRTLAFGGKQALSLGLPLLVSQNMSELRACLAYQLALSKGSAGFLSRYAVEKHHLLTAQLEQMPDTLRFKV